MSDDKEDYNENLKFFIGEMLLRVNAGRVGTALPEINFDDFETMYYDIGLKDCPHINEKGVLEPMTKHGFQILLKSSFNKVMLHLLNEIPVENEEHAGLVIEKLKGVKSNEKWTELSKIIGG